MHLSSGWNLDPSDLALPSEAWQAAGIRLGHTQGLQEKLARAGLWWVVPLGVTATGHAVGVGLTPGTPLRRSAVLLCKGAVAMTVGSSAAVLIPALLLRVRLLDPAGRERVRTAWKGLRAPLAQIHHRLGGDSLDAVGALMQHSGFDVDANSAADAQAQTALSAAMRATDPSAEHQRFHEQVMPAILAALDDREVPDVACDALGCWTARAHAILHRCGHRREFDSAASRRAFALLRQPAALDTCGPSTPSLVMHTNERLSERTLRRAAKGIVEAPVPEDIRSDWLFSAIAALGTDAPDLDASRLVEAVGVFDAEGQGKRAWDTLRSAAFWSRRVEGGRPWDQLPRLARMLAERNGWDEIAEVLARIVPPDTDPA